MEEAEFVKTMLRIVHSQGEEFRPFFEEAIGLIKEEFAEEIDLKSSEQQMIFTDYAYMIAKALQSKNKGKVQEEIMTPPTMLSLCAPPQSGVVESIRIRGRFCNFGHECTSCRKTIRK